MKKEKDIVINFIENEIPKIKIERDKYKESNSHAGYMNTDMIVDGAERLLKWIKEHD